MVASLGDLGHGFFFHWNSDNSMIEGLRLVRQKKYGRGKNLNWKGRYKRKQVCQLGMWNEAI